MVYSAVSGNTGFQKAGMKEDFLMKKRILAAFLALAMVCAILPCLALPAKAVDNWRDDNGATGDSAESPYTVSSYAQLNNLAIYVNSGNTL